MTGIINPPQFDNLINNYKEQIYYAKTNKLKSDAIALKEWDRLKFPSNSFQAKSNISKGGPLLSTIWNQGTGWNDQCPEDPNGPGGHVYAGCVAVAMAQVIRYWEWPNRGLGEFSYDHPVYGTLSANFGATNYGDYDWIYMYDNEPTKYTAKLLYHCGVSVEMDYDPSGSGASSFDAAKAFKEYFRYDNSAEMRMKNDYPTSEWENSLRYEIDNFRPVFYRGSSDLSGHAFVIDGYEGSNHFHVNWGWSGLFNDYFYLSELAPGTRDYTKHQGGIFKLLPDIVIEVPSDYPTIQEALSSACEDINIFVDKGIYYENITWPNINRISLKSLYGAEETIIDGMDSGTVLYINGSTINQSTQINGFTIQNGCNDSYGGGIYCNYSSPTISECIITNNRGKLGGGILFQSCINISINNATIIKNTAFYGGGICSFSSNLYLDNILIVDNSSSSRGGGLFFADNTYLNFNYGTVANNTSESGGGFHIGASASTSLVSNVTITNNSSKNGGGIYITGSSNNIENCTISNNDAYKSDGVFIMNQDDHVTNIHYSNYVNDEYDIYNYYRGQIFSENCYWGSSLSPTVSVGMGQVNYSPYLSQPDINAPPIPPQNVQITDIGCKFANLSWDPNPIGDLKGYKVYFNQDTLGYPYKNVINVNNITSYDLSGLIPNKTYNVAVTTCDIEGNESWYSKEILVRTTNPEVENLCLASGEDLHRIVNHKPYITFNCRNSSGEAYIGQIQISTDSTFSNIDIWNIQTTFSGEASIEYNGEPLIDGKKYFLRVRIGMDTSWSDWAMLNFRMNSKPTTPEPAYPINDQISETPVILKVLNSFDTEGDNLTYSFNLYSDQELKVKIDSSTAISEGINSTSWTVRASLPDNQQYFWIAFAHDGYEYSEIYNAASFLLNIENDTPDPFDLVSPAQESEVITLTPLLKWNSTFDPDPLDTISYTVYYGSSISNPQSVHVGVDTSYQIRNPLQNNTAYDWKVVAIDLNGATQENIGGYSQFTVNMENIKPTAPVIISPDSVIVVNLNVAFHWKESIDANPGDEVRYKMHWWGLEIPEDSISIDSNSVKVQLADNSQYFWKVFAYDNYNAFSESGTATFWIDAYPEPPLDFNTVAPLTDAHLQSESVDFIWSKTTDPDPLDEVYYRVVIASDWDNSDTYIYSELTIDTTLSMTLTMNDQYFWVVEAWDSDSLMTPSNNGQVYSFVLGSVSVLGAGIPTEFQLAQNYPNPFNPTTTIEYSLPEQADVKLIVYDIKGNTVKQWIYTNQNAGYYSVIWNGTNSSGSQVSTGIYFYRIIAGDFMQTKKMVFMK